ncbi:MAG: S-methyl-5-thioribose-1-phosphate isomerase [Pseudomonadales bacterium]|nr:S-methyl-5-thioribose-1-phosphate isomerase [Pseudomonadales bacterium]
MLTPSVVWQAGSLHLLDQTLLPQRKVVLLCESVEQVFEAIQQLRVRGAPAIGIAAAYGLLVDFPADADLALIRERATFLESARPTAVNLAWALRRMVSRAEAAVAAGEALLPALAREASDIHDEDRRSCRLIGEAGLSIVTAKPRVLTHCNAGALAVSELGTALAPIYLAHQQGVDVHVFVDETRPLLQGARLTAWELGQSGVPRTLIADNMVAHVMSRGLVDVVITGADRVAANGDAANKIGTLGVAVMARHYGIPFYIACPASTVDLSTPDGSAIEIEHRDPDEIRRFRSEWMSDADTPVLNPAFDVTPAELITGYMTDRGLLDSPQQLAATFSAAAD